MTTLPIRRAWSATCPDGSLNDAFVNAIGQRIFDENIGSSFARPELVSDFVDRCDTLFAALDSIETNADAIRAAGEVDTTDLYDMVSDD